jgi:rRNA maturation RNase YbeY
MRIVTAGDARVRGRAALERAAGMLGALGEAIPPRGRTVIVAVVGERRMAVLNRRYKSRRGPAEILTFPYRGVPGPRDESPVGEICLCWARLERGAKRRGVSPRSYAVRLVLHGLMHLAGRRHGTAQEERRMEAAERRSLRRVLGPRLIERLFA